jgi:hypothetical protein
LAEGRAGENFLLKLQAKHAGRTMLVLLLCAAPHALCGDGIELCGGAQQYIDHCVVVCGGVTAPTNCQLGFGHDGAIGAALL